MPNKKNHIKKILRYVHLYTALLSGLVLSVMGITGSLYVFEPELTAILEKDIYLTEKKESLFTDDISMAKHVEKISDRKIESIQWPKRGRETYVFKFFGDEKWYFFDQSTGKFLSGRKGLGNDIFTFILDLHMTLTLGETGRIITGVASLLFTFVMLSTGMYLWWPTNKGRRKTSFRVKWNARPKRLNYDLHNVIGFYFFIPLFLLGFTGAAFYFKDEMQLLVDKVTFSEPAPTPIYEVRTTAHPTTKDFMDVEEVLLEMNGYYPGLYKRNLWLTQDFDGALSFAYQPRIDIHSGPQKRITLRVDPVTAKVIAEENPDKMPRGASLMSNWQLPVHFGEFGGLFTRILWFMVGLIPAFLTYTGFKIWWGRRNKSRCETAQELLTAKK
ncbi:MAG: PepSY-associated TM helix domain-containing protein [Saonia sp.]